MKRTVLVVDDEPTFRIVAEEALAAEGFDVKTAGTLARARAELANGMPDVMVLDRRLPDGDGISLLPQLEQGSTLVIVVTAHGDVANAVEALRSGAWDYLAKPMQATDLVIKIRKAIEARGLKDRLVLARQSGSRPPVVEPRSGVKKAVVEKLRSLATSPLTPVLVSGPSGAGKQYAAETLHAMTYGASDADAPFVEINCAALPGELVESELFGHEKGAFTDAKNARRGLIEMADGGTLFLDELTEMPTGTQAKLLKFLDSMRFRRLGGARELEVKLRIVAATNQDVVKLVRAGKLREDLYHRLTVFQIAVPPLAQSREDIPELAQAFVRYFAGRVKKRVTGMSARALKVLCEYDYPGNVRELRNIIERAVILTAGPEIGERDVIVGEAGGGVGVGVGEGGFFVAGLRPDGTPAPLEQIERAYVARVLQHLEGRRMAAAEALGISYPTFLKRLRELGLE